ncbi:orotidine-5'-phosphate decarboxylase [Roseospira visakhapatnamensis]|uniref:Orotidine 5'-phosphate decarboxylase n=1 Tax=Roseospira visakhapatnamensis TaxID=390880 RepID=A0A7W6RE68_9PROT|nr:orotidine-5'-phosphate decarboxylase [Roseospira visakhapatnamensis]MBB4266828.1 orotidine-5'-phosphate decarboxylase [Roseospira visakhapatnamensis]
MPDTSALRNPVFVAVDTLDLAEARAWSAALTGVVGGIKLGLTFFSAHGAAGVRAVMGVDAPPLFLDLKFHDIPNTVAGAVRAVAPLAPAIINVHATGGRAMMRAALDAAGDEAARLHLPTPKVIAVTVLTSLDDPDLEATGVAPPVLSQVRRLAALSVDAGLDGVVCSPREVAVLRADLGTAPLLVTPGVRPDTALAQDQKRITTPAQALRSGASHLVIGRPITGAADPADAARRILADLESRP